MLGAESYCISISGAAPEHSGIIAIPEIIEFFLCDIIIDGCKLKKIRAKLFINVFSPIVKTTLQLLNTGSFL
jgi:hypothetical protein